MAILRLAQTVHIATNDNLQPLRAQAFIDVSDPTDVAAWAKRLQVTEAQVRAAVALVGATATNVTKLFTMPKLSQGA